MIISEKTEDILAGFGIGVVLVLMGIFVLWVMGFVLSVILMSFFQMTLAEHRNLLVIIVLCIIGGIIVAAIPYEREQVE